MKTTRKVRPSKAQRLPAFCALAVTFLIAINLAKAAPLKEARVTEVIKDVKLLPSKAAARPAAVNDQVREGVAVRTGVDSRSELTFADLTVTRLGTNTIFSFDQGTREMKLNEGAILVQIPPNAPAANITTAAVTAAITGGTALMEYHSKKGVPSRLLVLEGLGKVRTNKNSKKVASTAAGGLAFCWLPLAVANNNSNNGYVLVQAGEMITIINGIISQPFTFNVQDVVKKSKLIGGFNTKLANLDLIKNVINQQLGNQNTNPNNNNNNNTFQDSLDQRAAAAPIKQQDPFVCPF